jgi:hypothetical protein
MSLIVRYSLVGGAVVAGFVNFISCGAQMYKASLEGDSVEIVEGGEANSSDPSSPEFGLHAPSGWTKLPIEYTIERNINRKQLAALQSAMATWERAVGKKLFVFKEGTNNNTGALFPTLSSSLTDGFNGHYNDADWNKNGKKQEVLATTVWDNPNSDYRLIDAADIHYNVQYYLITDALTQRPIDNREIVDMWSLALHELGHLLGLAHVDESLDSSSIMNPALFIGEGMTSRNLSVGDIERIQKIYGCAASVCDATKIAREIMLTGQAAAKVANSTAH